MKNAGFAKKIRSVLIAVLEVGAVQAFAETQRTEWSNAEGGRFDVPSNWTPEATFAAGSTNVIAGVESLEISFGMTTTEPVNVHLIRPVPAVGSSLLTLDVLDKVWTLPTSATGGTSDYGEVPFAVATGEDIATTYALQLKQDRTAYAGSAPVMVSNVTLTVENSSAGMRTVFAGRSGSRGLVNLFDASEAPATTKTKALYVGRYADKSVLEFRDVDTVLPKVWLPPSDGKSATIRFNGGTHALNGNVAFLSSANQDAGFRATKPTYPTFEVTNGASFTVGGVLYMSHDQHGGYAGSRGVFRVNGHSTAKMTSFRGGMGINRFEVLDSSTLTWTSGGTVDGNANETNTVVVTDSTLNFYGDTKAGIGVGCVFGLFATNAVLSNRSGYGFSIERGAGTVDLVNSSYDGGFIMLGGSGSRGTVFTVRNGSSVHGDNNGGWHVSLGIGLYQYATVSTSGSGTAKVVFEEGTTGAFGGAVWIGGQAGHTGTLQVDGGDVYLSKSAQTTFVGHYGNGLLDIRGGTVRVGSNGLKIANQSGASGQVFLSGGTLVPVSVGVGSGTATMAVTGGTLRAPGDSESWISGIGTATIGGAGLTVDTDGHTVVIPQAFTAAAGESAKITKVGEGVLAMTAADGDYDEIRVAGGTFRLGDGVASAGAVSVVSNATFSMEGRTADLTLDALTVGDAETAGRLVLAAGAVLTVTDMADLGRAAVSVAGAEIGTDCTPLVVPGEMPVAVFEAIERSIVRLHSDPQSSVRVERIYDEGSGRTSVRVVTGAVKAVGETIRWKGSDSDWNDAGNWSPETVPGGENVAEFSGADGSAEIAAGGAEVSGVVVDGTADRRFVGTDRMRIGEQTHQGRISVAQANATFDVPLSFGGTLAADIAEGSMLALEKDVVVGDVEKSGAGTLALTAESVAHPAIRATGGTVSYAGSAGVSEGGWTVSAPSGSVTLDVGDDLELRGGFSADAGRMRKLGVGTLTAHVLSGVTTVVKDGMTVDEGVVRVKGGGDAAALSIGGDTTVYLRPESEDRDAAGGVVLEDGAFKVNSLSVGKDDIGADTVATVGVTNATVLIEKQLSVSGMKADGRNRTFVRIKDSTVTYGGDARQIGGSHQGPIWGGFADIVFDHSSLSLHGLAQNGAPITFAPRFAMTANGRLAFVNGSSYSGRNLRFSFEGYENKGVVPTSEKGLEFVFDGGTIVFNSPESSVCTNYCYYDGNASLGRRVPRAVNDRVVIGLKGMVANVAEGKSAYMRMTCFGDGGFAKTGPGMFVFLPAEAYVSVFGSRTGFVPGDVTNTLNYAGVTHVVEGTLGIAAKAVRADADFAVDRGAVLDLRGDVHSLGKIKGPGLVSGGTVVAPVFEVAVGPAGEVTGLPAFGDLSLSGKVSIDFGGTLAAAELGKPLTIGSFSGCDLSDVSRWKAVNTGLEQGVSVRFSLKDGILEATPERRSLMIIVR